MDLGDLAAADRSPESAATKLQAPMAAHPDQRPEDVTTLRPTLLFYVRLKQLRREHMAAQNLERRVGALDGCK